jgi:Protein of unknown function (DUF2924)
MKESVPNNPTAELIRSLPTLPKAQLIVLWNENFGRPAGRIRPELMLPILAFRIQERAEARQRFKPGTRLIREWKGQTHEVILTVDGYDYQGKRYKSLSPIACHITGTHWSGPAFFGTRKKESCN